ncbi:hypothetical protein [Legionella busanensis]|uniref:hypothetical protein n=1 Tax=Legionella busanensis TaxID=190655 RepID=UPI0011C050AE|nr:hypothetical protein [Legionella busanensis]
MDKLHAFTQSELTDYFKDLEKIMDEAQVVAPILLSSSNHAVCFYYDKNIRKWVYVDINDFARFPNLMSYTRELDSNSLAKSIFFFTFV